MSNESFPPAPADTSAVTIWDYYTLTRRMVAYFCATFAGYGLLVLVAFVVDWSFEDRWELSEIRQKSWDLLFVILQGTLGFGLYRGYFGLGRSAITMTSIAAILWLTNIAWMVYSDSKLLTSLYTSPDFVFFLYAMVHIFECFLFGGMIFFITYLLWRTNSSA